jgi:outer membrane receptor protein involved in Fe transport
MLSKRKALSMATLLLPQFYLAGAVNAQPSTAGGTPPDQPAPAEAAQPAAEAAQPTEPKRGKRAGEEEIVVTGSRVRRKDLTTPAPITVINKEQVEASGKVSIGDFLQTLPEQGNAINTSVNNGSIGDGSTRVSLRGLGSARTLVLLNGRRFVAGGAGANSSVDLSSIPANALERIEVLKDGASAVYGSDAIGGVINLITRKRMNGVEVNGYAGTSTHADGSTYDLNALAGTSGEKGNLLFSAGYYNQQTVWAGDRSFTAIPRAYSSTGIGILNNQVGEYSQGSGTVPQGTVIIPSSQKGVTRPNPNRDPRIDFYNQMVTHFPTANTFIWRSPTDPRDKVCDSQNHCWGAFTTATLYDPNNPAAGGDGYNFQPLNYLVTPQQRISLFSVGDVRLGSAARGYVEGSYMNRQGGQTLAPEPVALSQVGTTVSANNIYNPFGIDLGDVRRRMNEFGTRDFRQDIDTFRVVAGVDGTLPEETGVLKGWYWDWSFNYGRTIASNTKAGSLYVPAINDAVGPSNAAGQCVNAAGQVIAGCVPLNLFGGPGGVTSDQVTPNIAYTGNQHGFNQLVSAQLNTSGELFKIYSDRPVGLALGYEYRIVAGNNIPDPITVAGQTTGNIAFITAGHYYVNEGYGELSIPIVSGQKFIENLEASAAIRVFDYSNFGSDFTYKLGGRWSPVRDFTVRGTYSTGFRAPGVNELYLGTSDNFPTVSDPCRGPGVAGGGPVPANCLAQGIPATGTGDTQTQLRTKVGGNPALQPETAKIYTAGLVFEPRWLRGFSATVDYYNITIDKSIGTIGAPVILSQCYPTVASQTPKYCDLVIRDPNTLRIQNIIDTATNVGGDATDGIDLALNYLLPTEYGRWNFLFDGNWLHKFDRTLADGSVIHAKNTFDLGSGNAFGGVYPAFKFIAGVRWAYEGFNAGVNTRFVGAFHECGSTTGNFNGTATCYALQQPGSTVGVDSTTSRTVSAYNQWDLFAGYTFPWMAGRSTIGAGVNNIFNASPPLIYNGGFTPSDPSSYDYMGRFFYGRISHAF